MLRARAELMRDGMVDPEEVPVQAEGMLTELEQLQTVVQDLLTLARMQAPGYTVERQVCSLSEILRDAGRSLAQLARKQGVEFALELPECDPARDRVLTHYDRMRQLVMILGGKTASSTQSRADTRSRVWNTARRARWCWCGTRASASRRRNRAGYSTGSTGV